MLVLVLSHCVKYISYRSTVKKFDKDCPGASRKGSCPQWMTIRDTHKSIFSSSSYSLAHIFDMSDQEEYSMVAEVGSVLFFLDEVSNLSFQIPGSSVRSRDMFLPVECGETVMSPPVRWLRGCITSLHSLPILSEGQAQTILQGFKRFLEKFLEKGLDPRKERSSSSPWQPSLAVAWVRSHPLLCWATSWGVCFNRLAWLPQLHF